MRRPPPSVPPAKAMIHRKNPRKYQSSTTSTPSPPKLLPPSTNHLNYLIWLSLIATFFKLLLIPAYHSTDFEVHRHWLALTHSLPLAQWYSDETSPWTLDYPPFFAHFEHFLSFFANLVDPTVVHLTNGLNYKSHLTILFQRLSVILSDFVLFYGIYRITQKIDVKSRFLTWILVIWSPCLIIVDHIHFQYNGFLLGMLLVSLCALEDGNDLMGGFVFAVLLCFKHLFAVAAPVYFVYLLRHYCRGGFVRGFRRLVMMGSVVVAVFAAAYGPFLYYGQIQQVFRRMFPFGRGLCHAYWAPNFWVFYIMFDKLLTYMLIKLGFNVNIPTASFTGGLVGDSSPFAVLPTITPLISLTMVLLAMAPCLVEAWRAPKPRMITRWVAYAYTCGFMFGWHVHEKASLHFVIPLAIIALKSAVDAKHYFLLSVVSCYSLFPLLYEPQEYPIKVLLLLLHCILTWLGISSRFSSETSPEDSGSDLSRTKKARFRIGWLTKSYLVSILVVELVGQVLHPLLLGNNKLPFLPLLLISSYCAFGMMYSWIWQLSCILQA